MCFHIRKALHKLLLPLHLNCINLIVELFRNNCINPELRRI